MVCGCALAMAMDAQAPPATQQAATDAFRTGLAAAQAGNFAAAESAFTRVVQLAPGIAAAHSALGAVLVREGRFAQAIPELQRALQLDGDDVSARLNFGIAAAAVVDGSPPPSAAGRADLAAQGIASLQRWKTRQNRPLPTDGAMALARLQVAAGALPDAIQSLTEAASAAPSDATLHDALGILLARQKSYPASVTQFQAALALLPPASADRRADTELHLGAALLAMGDAAGAVVELQRAVSLQPREIAARIQLGAAQFTAGNEAAALATLREATRLDPQSAPAAYQLALTLESAGHSDQALPLFEQVRKARPNDPELLTNYGLALVELGRAKDAVTVYQQAALLDPGNATLHQDLGVAYLQQSDLDHAIAEFRRGLEAQPDSAQLAYDLGLALKLKDNLPDAIVAFERARTLDPTLADAPYTLGVLYMQQGRFADAATSLQQAVALRPQNADAWSTLGSVLKQDGKPQPAVDALRKAIALDPGQPGNHVNLASVLVELGQKDEAIRERKTAADLSRAATTKQKERFALDSGSLLRQRGQFAEAIVQFRNAVLADPQDPAAHTALADALGQTGATAEADAERAKARALASK